jgi:PadR family transcriptional regulator PadR
MNLKDTLPTLTLEALITEPNHGYQIAQMIKERSQVLPDFKEGTLYPALHKLENDGMVKSFEGVDNGRPQSRYHITR